MRAAKKNRLRSARVLSRFCCVSLFVAPRPARGCGERTCERESESIMKHFAQAAVLWQASRTHHLTTEPLECKEFEMKR